MSYATEKARPGREPCTIVELDLDVCARTYGNAPCTAAVGVTGADRCFNTRKTCQVPAAYAASAFNLWNPADKGSTVVLSGGDLTMTAGPGTGGVRAIASKASGKWYFEVTATTLGAGGLVIGVSRATAGQGYPGQDAHGIGYYSTGSKVASAVTTAYGAAYVNGDVISVLYDADARTIAFWRNGVAQPTIPTGLVGELLPMVGAIFGTGVATANFGATSFVYTMPAGYASWQHGKKTYRFTDSLVHSAVLAPYIPSIQDVDITPARLEPGKGLGLRASVVVTFRDHPSSDRGDDPYVSQRAYDPAQRGTYWGKLLARNPYYQGRIMRVRTGYIGSTFSLSDFETRTYVIESIDGPDASGRVRITGKDLLKLADDDRAQAPRQSTGKLAGDINAAVTSATLAPAGIGNSEYAASGWAIIGSEIVSFTRVADALTITRAQYGTVAAAHSTNDVVQQCLRYNDQTVPDVVKDLLTTYASVALGYLDYAAWVTEFTTWLANLRVSTLIPKPVGVNTLLAELSEQGTGYFWWDERASLVRGKVLHPVQGQPTVSLDDSANIIADSLTVKHAPAARLSQVWVLFGQMVPTEALDKPSNYQGAVVSYDLSAEGAEQYGDKRVKKIYSRWLPSTAGSQAALVAARLLARYRDVPFTIALKLDAKDSSLWTGDDAQLTTRAIQNPDGSSPTINAQVLEVREVEAGTVYAYELINSFFAGRYAFITPDAQPAYPVATEPQRSRYGFICNDAGKMADGSDGYKII